MNDSSLSIAAGTLSALMRGDGGAVLRMPLSRPAVERETTGAAEAAVVEVGKAQTATALSGVVPDPTTQVAQRQEPQAVLEPMSTAEIEDVLNDINEFLRSTQRALEFSVDDDTGIQIITVWDTEREEVIRQIPPEVIVALIKHFRDTQEINATGVAEKA